MFYVILYGIGGAAYIAAVIAAVLRKSLVVLSMLVLIAQVWGDMFQVV